MIYLNSFLFAGFVCLVGQLILDNTKLTPGHVTALFVVLGAALDTFNIYDKIIEKVGAGATTLIMNFGNSNANGEKCQVHRELLEQFVPGNNG